MSTAPAPAPSAEQPKPREVGQDEGAGPGSRGRAWALTGVILLCVLGLGEILADRIQRSRVPTRQDWEAAARAVRQAHRPGELIVTAPGWADPLGRLVLGDLMTLDDVTRPDAATYAAIYELSLRGARHADTRRARVDWRRTFGRITATRYVQTPAQVTTDFYEALPSAKVWEERGGRPSPPCAWDARRARFRCGPGWKAVRAIRAEVGFAARRCIDAHPIDGAARVLEFRDVDPGDLLVIHTGYAGYDPRYRARRAVWEYRQWQRGRLRKDRPLAPIASVPVTLAVTVDGQAAGRVSHDIEDESFRRAVLGVPRPPAARSDPVTAAGRRATVRFTVTSRYAWSKTFCFHARAERRRP